MMAPATNLNVIKNPKFMLPPFISEKASSVSLVYISLPHNFKQKNSNMMIAFSISLISILQSNRMFFCLFFCQQCLGQGKVFSKKFSDPGFGFKRNLEKSISRLSLKFFSIKYFYKIFEFCFNKFGKHKVILSDLVSC